MNNINIIEYHDKYRAGSIELLKKAFPGSSDEATFAWRFNTTEQNKPIIICAVDADKVVSFNSWIIWKFTNQAKTYIGYQSGESATDNSYRRMGIWGKVIKLGEEIAKARGIDFFFGFPAPISFGGFIKAGYHAVGSFDMALRIINPFLLHPNLTNTIDPIDFSWTGVHKNNKTITPIVDKDYIDWRYHRNPKQYHIITYAQNQETASFVVRQTRYYNKKYKISFSEIHLLDFFPNSLNQTFLKEALRHLDSVFSRRAVWIKTFFNRETERGRALSHHFKINFKSRGPTLIYKKINPELDENIFMNLNHWDIFPHVMDSY